MPAKKDPIKAVFGWWAKLPESMRPMKLARAYPHIVNNLALFWDDRQQCDTYLSSLIFSADRPLREGFPPEISQEILALHNYHAKRANGRAANVVVRIGPILRQRVHLPQHRD